MVLVVGSRPVVRPSGTSSFTLRQQPQWVLTPTRFTYILNGAGGGSRTHTDFHPRDFKSRASAIPPHQHAATQSSSLPNFVAAAYCFGLAFPQK